MVGRFGIWTPFASGAGACARTDDAHINTAAAACVLCFMDFPG
jgi:hypothetical protein